MHFFNNLFIQIRNTSLKVFYVFFGNILPVSVKAQVIVYPVLPLKVKWVKPKTQNSFTYVTRLRF